MDQQRIPLDRIAPLEQVAPYREQCFGNYGFGQAQDFGVQVPAAGMQYSA